VVNVLIMNVPENPIAAVVHPDPYPYYASLVERAPMARDETLGMWIAASAEAARAVLASERCRVRPAFEPVPAAIVGTTAGSIFAHLARMRDGAAHTAPRCTVVRELDVLDAGRVGQEAAEEARSLLGSEGSLARLVLRLPARAIARVLGVPHAELDRIAEWVDDFAGCLAPGASAGRLARGKAAADRLLERMAGSADLAANRVGLLAQAHEATAGLIGNTLVAIGRSHRLRERLRRRPEEVDALLDEVLRDDPPVQNTRRFVAQGDRIAGVEVREGDTILVVLAAAQRDPSVRGVLAFGAGVHICPGAKHAKAIAAAAIHEVLATGLDPAALVDTVAYRPSANLRVPLFGAAAREVAS
jgi:cytochrome P450